MPEAIENLGNPALVEQVCNEILEGDSTAWEDIAGQDDAKRLVQELVVWPMLNPALCTVRHRPKPLFVKICNDTSQDTTLNIDLRLLSVWPMLYPALCTVRRRLKPLLFHNTEDTSCII